MPSLQFFYGDIFYTCRRKSRILIAALFLMFAPSMQAESKEEPNLSRIRHQVFNFYTFFELVEDGKYQDALHWLELVATLEVQTIDDARCFLYDFRKQSEAYFDRKTCNEDLLNFAHTVMLAVELPDNVIDKNMALIDDILDNPDLVPQGWFSTIAQGVIGVALFVCGGIMVKVGSKAVQVMGGVMASQGLSKTIDATTNAIEKSEEESEQRRKAAKEKEKSENSKSHNSIYLGVPTFAF